VQIGILGPFEVRTDAGALADVPGARLRALLIALALEPGRVVSKATLIDWIWGEQPPADTANALQRLVSRLRKALPEGLIEGQPGGGYRLTVEPDAVDAVRFERLAAQARDAEGSRRARLLRDALALWRGAAMADVGLEDSEALDAAVARLERLRLAALEDRFEAEVGLGRGADLVAELTDLVAAHPERERHRLTTLIGPGGSGKTRLATETARTLLGDLPDGVWLVELAAIGADSTDSDMAQATLAALGLRDALLGTTPNPDPVDGLIAAIREREALLILDNCEHVIESAAEFADRVLGECRRLWILATSREPLGITGEALWLVEPLAVPEGASPGEIEIESSPAIRLLRDRAGAVRRDLGGDTRTLATMVRVCRALDGMPLAIELAAARLRTMTIDQLANRLDDRFRLLTGGSRTAWPRHKTLRAVVDWSWELLTEPERMVLRRLSVFSGGASLEASEWVCAAHGVEQSVVKQDGVLELLTSLAEKSLLLTEGDGALRYRMLGTIKEYAADRLAEAGESDRVRQAHLGYVTELAESAEPHLRRAEQLAWLRRLEADHDNIGAAMRGAIAADEAQAAMRLAAALGWYWWLGGRRSEGFELIVAATKIPGEVTDEVRAMVYALVVTFATSGRGDGHEAAEWIHQAYRFSQRSQRGNPLLALVAPLERMLQAPGDFMSAWEPALDSEDPWVRALARLQLGKMQIMLGQAGGEAEANLELALAEFRAIGERFGISFALSELAEQIARRGEFAGACELHEEAAAVVTEVGATEDVIRIRTRQALLYWLNGDQDASAAAIAEAQRIADGVTWPYALVELALARPLACSRPASPYADCRIAPTRMPPGSSRRRSVTSAKHGSPR